MGLDYLAQRNNGVFAGTVLVVLAALLIIRSRGLALGDSERALYWAGSALAVGYSLVYLSLHFRWSFIRFLPELICLIVGSILIALSAMFIMLARGTALGSAERAIYWLVSTLAITVVLGLVLAA